MDPSPRKVLFISKGADAASTRYRAAQYLPLLAHHGWSCAHLSAAAGTVTLLRAAAGADVVVLLRRTLAAPLAHLLRRAARRLVFDFDDAVFTTPAGPSRGRARRFDAIVRRCDLVWAGNACLAERARAVNARVVELPTAVDVRRYHKAVRADSGPVELVWIGSRATAPYLEQVLPALAEAARDAPPLVLKAIADVPFAAPGLAVRAVAWSTQTEAADLACSDIGLAPLPDDPYARGKCGLKIVQYMASGLPVIAAPVGAQATLVEEGATGLLADTPDAWRRAVIRLAQDAGLRRRLGAAGRARAAEHYDLAVVGTRLIGLLEELVASVP